MLAHKAEEEGVFVAETIAGQKPHINYNLNSWSCIYLARSGCCWKNRRTTFKEEGVAYKSGQFPMRALGRSRASMDLDGFVKILADETTDEILGVHMIGARCADLNCRSCSCYGIPRICRRHLENVSCTSNILLKLLRKLHLQQPKIEHCISKFKFPIP